MKKKKTSLILTLTLTEQELMIAAAEVSKMHCELKNPRLYALGHNEYDEGIIFNPTFMVRTITEYCANSPAVYTSLVIFIPTRENLAAILPVHIYHGFLLQLALLAASTPYPLAGIYENPQALLENKVNHASLFSARSIKPFRGFLATALTAVAATLLLCAWLSFQHHNLLLSLSNSEKTLQDSISAHKELPAILVAEQSSVEHLSALSSTLEQILQSPRCCEEFLSTLAASMPAQNCLRSLSFSKISQAAEDTLYNFTAQGITLAPHMLPLFMGTLSHHKSFTHLRLRKLSKEGTKTPYYTFACEGAYSPQARKSFT